MSNVWKLCLNGVNLLLNSHSLNIPKYLRPNVNNRHIQGKDELLHRRHLIHLNSKDNHNILIRHKHCRKRTHLHFCYPLFNLC